MFIKRLGVAIAFVLALTTSTHALIHNLRVQDDTRSRFFIENFGFEANGHLQIEIGHLKVGGQSYSPPDDGKHHIGFLIKRTDVDSTAFLEENGQIPCLLDAATDKDIVIELSGDKMTSRDQLIEPGQEGFYNTYFISCIDEPVTFSMRLTQFNVGASGKRSYLSAGRAPLPLLFATLTATHFCMLVAWFIFAIKKSEPHLVHRVHHLMSLLILLKMLAMAFKTIDYHVQATTGTARGWGVIYYLFAGAKGLLMFVLIALIGTGWKFVKPFLQAKDKRVFMVVIPLQLLDNIALIVIEEAAPGSQGFFTWKDIFRLVDILCCGAILLPIIWSINHLREASQIDGKAARNLNKLKLFRQFYLMVVSYIYFTRIIIFLMDATLPFRYVWLGDFFAELATIVFFCISGYMFRPLAENPYLSLRADETEDEGYGTAQEAATAAASGGGSGGGTQLKRKGHAGESSGIEV